MANGPHVSPSGLIVMAISANDCFLREAADISKRHPVTYIPVTYKE